MADKLLDVNGLTVSVEEKEILHDINLSINALLTKDKETVGEALEELYGIV